MTISEDDGARIAGALEFIGKNLTDLAPEPAYQGHRWTFIRQETRIEARYPHGAITATFDVFHCSGCPECRDLPAYRLIRAKEIKGEHRSYEDRPIFELPTPPREG